MQTEIIGEQIVQGFLAGIIGGVFKNFRAEILGEANDFKKMAVAIASKRRDAHASENFSQTGVYGAASFLHAARFERFGKLIREVRQHSAGPSGHKQGDMMGIKNLRRFDNQGHIRQSFTNHGFPYSRGSKKSRQRCAFGADGAIGNEEEPRAPAAAQRGRRKLSKTTARPRNSRGGRKSNVDALFGAENGGKLRELAVRNHRAWQRDAISQVDIERHDVSFAQGINRRLGDHSKALLGEVPPSSRERG